MIHLAQDFTKYPAGRYRSDGQYSGEVFREDFLVPALRSGDEVEVVLDGALGYGSSFLEEAFGGLVRESKMDPVDLRKRLRLQTTRKGVLREIWEYIENARAA